jgi:hypothetical protein
MMSRASINISGACGGGSSVKIYETLEYDAQRRGACVMHGSFTAGQGGDSRCRIEVVELQLPGLDIRVRADDVRTELQAMIEANSARQAADWSMDLRPGQDRAFADLQAAMLRIAAPGITVSHIEHIAREAYLDGKRHGEESARRQLREMLGIRE